MPESFLSYTKGCMTDPSVHSVNFWGGGRRESIRVASSFCFLGELMCPIQYPMLYTIIAPLSLESTCVLYSTYCFMP